MFCCCHATQPLSRLSTILHSSTPQTVTPPLHYTSHSPLPYTSVTPSFHTSDSHSRTPPLHSHSPLHHKVIPALHHTIGTRHSTTDHHSNTPPHHTVSQPLLRTPVTPPCHSHIPADGRVTFPLKRITSQLPRLNITRES